MENFLSTEDFEKAVIDIVKDWSEWVKNIDHNTLKYLLRLLINQIELSKDEINVVFNDNINNFLCNVKRGQLI